MIADERDDLEHRACEDCGGTGIIEIDSGSRTGEHITISKPCPSCTDDIGSDRAWAFADEDDWDSFDGWDGPDA